MGAKDVLALDLAAREGLEKLGYTQEMTRVRVVASSFRLVEVEDISVRRRVACSTFFSVSSIRPVVSVSLLHLLSLFVRSDIRFVLRCNRFREGAHM